MAYLDVNFYSITLGLSTSMGVILPEADQGIGVSEGVWDGVEPLPVLYLLQGLSDNHTIWMRRTSLDRYVAGKKMAIVMPEVGRGYYVNQKLGFAYQRFIVEELPTICQRFFRISADRDKNFIAGLSMGGYGAMMAGLNYPERYGYVASMSGALDWSAMDDFALHARASDATYMSKLKAEDFASYHSNMEFMLNFGSTAEYLGSENDILAAIDRVADASCEFPKLRLSIGTEDYLYNTNVSVRKKLDSRKIPYIYNERPGKHEWSMWDYEIQRVLEWLPVSEEKPIGNGGDQRKACNEK